MRTNSTFSSAFSAAYRKVISESALTRTETTLNNMKSVFRSYLTFLKAQKGRDAISLRIDDFCAETAKEYIAYLISSNNSPASINQKISTLRSIIKRIGINDHKYKYLFSEWQSLPVQKCTKGYVDDVLSERAVEAIIKVCESNCSEIGQKYTSMIALGYYTATRVDEVISLHIKDLKLDGPSPYITVLGKGRKTRSCPIDKKISKCINSYTKQYHAHIDPEDYVFGRSGDFKNKLTSQGINLYLKRIALKANSKCKDVPLTLHYHQLRKARATHLLAHGMPIEQIAELLGHESIDTTRTYLGISKEMKFDAINRIIPESLRTEQRRYPKNNDINELFKI